jgi:hypothetical protein
MSKPSLVLHLRIGGQINLCVPCSFSKNSLFIDIIDVFYSTPQ